jgi:hypothetical protein
VERCRDHGLDHSWALGIIRSLFPIHYEGEEMTPNDPVLVEKAEFSIEPLLKELILEIRELRISIDALHEYQHKLTQSQQNTYDGYGNLCVKVEGQ